MVQVHQRLEVQVVLSNRMLVVRTCLIQVTLLDPKDQELNQVLVHHPRTIHYIMEMEMEWTQDFS